MNFNLPIFFMKHYIIFMTLVEVWGIEPQLLLVTPSRKTISLSLSPPKNKNGRYKIPRGKEANPVAKHTALKLPPILLETLPIICITLLHSLVPRLHRGLQVIHTQTYVKYLLQIKTYPFPNSLLSNA